MRVKMRRTVFILIAFSMVAADAWSSPFYPVQRAPMRFTRYAPLPPPQRIPIRVMSRSRLPEKQQTIPVQESEESENQRSKRDDYNYDHDHNHDHEHGTRGVTGPVHTFVKTDKNANYKWGVRHHVGNKYAS